MFQAVNQMFATQKSKEDLFPVYSHTQQIFLELNVKKCIHFVCMYV